MEFGILNDVGKTRIIKISKKVHHNFTILFVINIASSNGYINTSIDKAQAGTNTRK